MASLFPIGLSLDSSECSIHFLIFSHIITALESGLSYFLLKYKSETKKEKKRDSSNNQLKNITTYYLNSLDPRSSIPAGTFRAQ